MNAVEIQIACILAERASRPGGAYITYPILASEVRWYNATGQGLGRHLAQVLQFCRHNGLPIITAIVCATGTKLPSARGIEAMRHELGRDIDVPAEQDAVFRFDWTTVPEFGLRAAEQTIDFRKLVAMASDFFAPELCSMLIVSDRTMEGLGNVTRSNAFILLYSDPRFSSASPDTNGRLLGIVEVEFTEASATAAIDPEFLEGIQLGQAKFEVRSSKGLGGLSDLL